MKAFVISEPDAQIVEMAEVPIPKIDDEVLLVCVEAVGVGIHDSCFLPSDAGYPFPIGIEAARVVEETGNGVHSCRRGDRIALVSSIQSKGGTVQSTPLSKRDRSSRPFPPRWISSRPRCRWPETLH